MKKNIHHLFLFFTLFFIASTVSKAYADGIKNEGFVLNKGQWPDHVLSRAEFSFGDVILQKDGLVFFLRNVSNRADHTGNSVHGHDSSHVINAHVYKMKFRNGHIESPRGFNSSDFHVNFIKGNDQSTWSSNLFCYKKLIIGNIYPSIDLVLYVTDNGLKYDLLLKSKADPKQIIIDYEGTDGLSIDAQGNLQVKTSLGIITEKMPIAFLEKTNQSKEPVICRYQLSGNTVQFNIKNLTRAKEEKLVIDPELIFSTYSGSRSDNWGNTATYDKNGYSYAAGITFNNGFPTTVGAFQQSFQSYNNDPDVAVLKLDQTGKLVYATYLGGDIAETPTSTIVNDQGELYILGTTGSNGALGGNPFPTTIGAYDRSFNGGNSIYPLGEVEGILHPFGCDIFISRLNSVGNLISSTLIGGTGNDGVLPSDTCILSKNYGDEFRSEILLDSLGDVYFVSSTESIDIMSSKPGYNKSYNGGVRDGIAMKLKADLTDIIWNTYLGGNEIDACYSLQFGAANDIFITGGTTSNNLPTAGGLNPTYAGAIDGFIFRLSTDGLTLMNGTYLGTSFFDQGYLVQTDKLGFVYVLGHSQGNYPIINSPYSNPNSKQFIHKLNATLNTTIFSTQIGSGRSKIDFVPTAFLVNDCENIFISGWGGSVNSTIYGQNSQGGNSRFLPVTSNAFQPTTIDGSDFYLMVLKKDMQQLLYATYFGGRYIPEHVDGGTSRFDKRGIVYESVCACKEYEFDPRTGNYYPIPPDFPVTPGSNSTVLNGINCNNAVFKFDLSSLKADFDVDTSKICGSGPVTFTNKSLGGSIFIWDLGDGTTSNSSTTFTHVYSQPGTYTVQLIAIDETTCVGRDTAEKIIHIYDLPNPQFAIDSVVICIGDTAQLNATYNPHFTYLWSPNQYLTDPSIHNPGAFPPLSQYYQLHIKDDSTQCESTDSILVKVLIPVADTRYENITGCSGQPTVHVKNYSKDFIYKWNFGDGSIFESNSQETIHSYTEFGDYLVTVLVHRGACSITDTVQVHIPVVKIPNLFTPNGDNLNDKYVIEGMTKNWKLDIYNRWGNAVYTRDPYDQTWDGADLNGGIYYFLITDPAGNKCKGWVHVFK